MAFGRHVHITVFFHHFACFESKLYSGEHSVIRNIFVMYNMFSYVMCGIFGPRLKECRHAMCALASPEGVLGLARLLRVAQASAEFDGVGEACVSLLDRSVASLLERNGLSPNEVERPPNTAELMSIPTLLRALDYARAEAVRSLHDQTLAEVISQCIGLIRAHRPWAESDVPRRSARSLN